MADNCPECNKTATDENPAVERQAPSHICKFEPAKDLLSGKGWLECICGKKMSGGHRFYRPKA